ncbi:hypothetical protein [Alishewanella longhuensis]
MIKGGIRYSVKRGVARWLDNRQPAGEKLSLGQGVIYILPSRFGCWFIFLIILLYLLGTNYQNNLILLSSFVFLSVMLSSMLMAFFNLHQLQLSVIQDADTFAETPAMLPLQLKKKQAQMLQISLKGQRLTQLLPLLQGETQFQLQLPVLGRGCYPLPRLLLSSSYPMGLFGPWSYPALKAQIWVYPKPATTDAPELQHQTIGQAQHPHLPAEPDQLKPYQLGDSPKRIVWKKLRVCTTQPIVRQLSQQPGALPEWIVIPALQGAALEQALSYACQALITLEQQGGCYALQTPLSTLAPGKGKPHLTRCLQELALC